MGRYSAFEHLWRSVIPGQSKKALMCMFTVHLDESYGRADAYSVAAYVGKVEQWGELERELTELAQKEDYKVLHKVDLENFENEFKWPYLTYDEKVKRRMRINRCACGIILRRVRAGFGYSVVKSVWEQADKGRWENLFGKSFYAAGAFACLALVKEWADKFNVNEPIRYVFERGAEGRDEVENMLRKVEKQPDLKTWYRMAGWSFESKKDEIDRKGNFFPAVIPLQAADFLAYEVYRHMDNRIVDGVKLDRQGNKIEPRWPLRCLLQATPEYARYAHLDSRGKPTPHWIQWQSKSDLERKLRNFESAFDGDPDFEFTW